MLKVFQQRKFKNEKESPGTESSLKVLWCLYPFKEGAIFRKYYGRHKPSYGIAVSPTEEQIKKLMKIIGSPLHIATVGLFLVKKCAIRDLEALSLSEVIDIILSYPEKKSI